MASDKKQLASNGVSVVVTARNEKRGAEAVEKLKSSSGFSDKDVIFHQLDVTDSSSVAALAEFVKTQFGKLDILVNNAGIGGTEADADAFRALASSNVAGRAQINWKDILTESYELTVECLDTNYYGAKRMIEGFLPLLHLSKSPRIVNVSSSMGRLKNLPNEWAKGIFRDADNLTEERVEEVLKEYLKDFKDGSFQEKGWPPFMSAYILSKAAMNAYSRIFAKKYPNIQINCVCPGYVKTDINYNTGRLTVEEGAESVVRLVFQPDDGPSGVFFDKKEAASFE